MPERDANGGDESWAQTLITITPEEDAAVRTITENTVISSVGDTPLVLGVDQIADRRTVPINTIRGDFFVDNTELEKEVRHNDASCQTFLRGVPKVELPSVLKDEATQTVYLGSIAPHVAIQHFQDIAGIMNDRIMPTSAKVTEMTQTFVTFPPKESREQTIERLTTGLTLKEILSDVFTPEERNACVTDTLHFILARVFWLSDPGYRQPEVKLKDEAAQTCIKYDIGMGKIVLDADTQTSLTCEPRRSNTGLLSEWSALKEFARKMIHECLERGVHPRTVVHSILDEVVERCADQIHLPYRNKIVQTLAPCDALKDRDDEVLRKLRIEVVLDSLESSIVVLPLIENLLEQTRLEIRERAPTVAAQILNRILKNSVTIAIRLAAIRQEVASHKPTMEGIFDARKKRLKELLGDKKAAKLCSSTQTELAGVPDIAKLKEPRETICSTCVRHSECYVCAAVLNDEDEEPNSTGKRDIVHEKVLRTQDILIAYNPCYLVTTPSKIPETHPPIARKQLPVTLTKTKRPEPSSKVDFSASKPEIDVCPEERKSAKLAKDLQGSISAESKTVPNEVLLSSTCLPGKANMDLCTRSRCGLSVRSVKALRILKRTFNRNEESCSDCSYGGEKLDLKGPREGTGGSISSEKISEKNENRNIRPHGEGVRIVPIIHVANKIDKK